MKKRFNIILLVPFALFLFAGCTGNQLDSTKSFLSNEGDQYFFILDSKAGKTMEDLQGITPYEAVIQLSGISETAVNVSIDYAFKPAGVTEKACALSVSFRNVPYVDEGDAITFNTDGLTGNCQMEYRDYHFSSSAEFRDVSLKGSLSKEDSHLSIEGLVNDSSFALMILSSTPDQASFVPQYNAGIAEVEWVNLDKWEVTNTSSASVSLELKALYEEHVIQRQIAPEESVVLDVTDVFYSNGVEVVITYPDEQASIVLYSPQYRSSDEHFILTSQENRWYPVIEAYTGMPMPYQYYYTRYEIH